MPAEPLYRSPGGVALYTQADVDHLLRFYPWQPFELVEVGDRALQERTSTTISVDTSSQDRQGLGPRKAHEEAEEVDG